MKQVLLCPLCYEPVVSVSLEDGVAYHDDYFQTARYGTFEELGPAERWERAERAPEFDRTVMHPCGHAARGTRAREWTSEMVKPPRGISLAKRLPAAA